MKKLKLIKEGKTLYQNIKEANFVWDRLKGLMFQNKEIDFDGILIHRSNSIHTFFMNFSIDVYFLNKNNEVLKVFLDLSPRKVTFPVWGGRKVLEIPSHANQFKNMIKKGDRLEFDYV